MTGAGADKGLDESARQFLLAEYTMIREMRAKTMSLVEERVRFVTTLQAAEIAFIGTVFIRSNVTGNTLCLLIMALGGPTLIFSHIVYLRALDFQIMGRKYLRAINAIRGFFVQQHPEIKDAILMSTDPKKPSMSSVGEGSSTLLSFATTVLIIRSLQLLSIVVTIAWFLLQHFFHLGEDLELSLSIAIGFSCAAAELTFQSFRLRARLLKAENT